MINPIVSSSPRRERVAVKSEVIFALAFFALAACNQPNPEPAVVALEKFTIEVPGTSFPTHTALQLRAVALYTDGSKVNVTNQTEWTTLDSTVGQIGATGIAQLNGVGQARFEGTFRGRRVPVHLEVTGATLEVLTIASPSQGALARGDTRRFTASARFSDGTVLDVTEQTTWIADGVALAMTYDAGVVVGRATGNGLLHAHYFSQRTAVSLEVTRPRFAALTLKAPARSLRPGDTHQLALEATFSDGSTRDVAAAANWTSSDSNVADLSTNGIARGLVFARSAGHSHLTATWEGTTATLELIIDPRQVTNLVFAATQLALAQGRSGGLDVIAELDDGSTMVVTAAASWSSSQPTVAEVDSAGALTTLAMGLTTIRAEYAGLEAKYDVLVTAPVLTAIEATLTGGRLLVGQTARFLVSGTFSDGAVLNLSPFITMRHGAAVTSSVSGDRLTVTGAIVGSGQVELELAGVIHQLDFEVSGAQLVTVDLLEHPQRIWYSPGSLLQGPRRFHAVATYDDGEQLDASELCTWSLEDGSVASLSDVPGSRGRYALSLGGVTTVRATMGGVTSTLAWNFPPQP